MSALCRNIPIRDITMYTLWDEGSSWRIKGIIKTEFVGVGLISIILIVIIIVSILVIRQREDSSIPRREGR